MIPRWLTEWVERRRLARAEYALYRRVRDGHDAAVRADQARIAADERARKGKHT